MTHPLVQEATHRNDRRAVARRGISLSRELAAIPPTRTLILGAGGLALAVGLASAAWMARGITRPIRPLVEGSREIAAGRFEYRMSGNLRG